MEENPYKAPDTLQESGKTSTHPQDNESLGPVKLLIFIVFLIVLVWLMIPAVR